MTKDVFVTIIVPANIIDPLRRVCRFLGIDTDGMFISGLSATGSEPATHYISTGKVYSRFTNAMRNGDELYDFAVERCAERNIDMPYTRTQVKGALGLCDVSTDDPYVAVERLGLQFVTNDSMI